MKDKGGLNSERCLCKIIQDIKAAGGEAAAVQLDVGAGQEKVVAGC